MNFLAPFRGEVYLHWNTVTDKGYVGQTTAGVSSRWRDQVKITRWPTYAGYNYPLARAIRKYGPDVFDHQVLSVAKSKAELDNLEKVWIILLQTRETGYNLAAGGEGNPGLRHTEESKKKISKNRTGKALGNKNAAGHIKTQKVREHHSCVMSGHVFSESHNQKIRVARTGVLRPDISVWNKKRWADPSARRQQSEKLKAVNKDKLIRDAHGHIIGRKE